MPSKTVQNLEPWHSSNLSEYLIRQYCGFKSKSTNILHEYILITKRTVLESHEASRVVVKAQSVIWKGTADAAICLGIALPLDICYQVNLFTLGIYCCKFRFQAYAVQHPIDYLSNFFFHGKLLLNVPFHILNHVYTTRHRLSDSLSMTCLLLRRNSKLFYFIAKSYV